MSDYLHSYRRALTRLRAFRSTLRQPKGTAAVRTREWDAPTYRTPTEVADELSEGEALRADKRAGRIQAVWRFRVGPAPRCTPDDRLAAASYLARLERVAEGYANWQHGPEGTAPLTRSEAAYLRRQIEKWRARAVGADPWFIRNGTRPGRPPGS
jgi:hypothetical protein